MRAEDLAHVAWEAQRALRVVNFAVCMPKSWSLTRGRNRDRGIEAARMVIDNPTMTPKAIQAVASKHLKKDGWTFGPLDFNGKTSPQAGAWDDLTEPERQEWVLFVAIVRALAAEGADN